MGFHKKKTIAAADQEGNRHPETVGAASADKRRIGFLLRRFLFIVVAVMFVVVTIGVWIIQTGVARESANDALVIAIEDSGAQVETASGVSLLAYARDAAERFSSADPVPSREELAAYAESQGISEINLVNEDGIIFATTVSLYEGYNMRNGEQSAQFLALLDGSRQEFVQEYRARSYDETAKLKYAGVATPYGFVQVGYDVNRFQQEVSTLITDSTKYRHVGSRGGVAVARLDGTIVSQCLEHDAATLDDAVTGREKVKPAGDGYESFEAIVYGNPSFCMGVESEGFSIVAYLPKDEALYQARLVALAFMGFEIILFTVLFFMIRSLFNHLMVTDVHRANEALGLIAEGNLDVKVDARTTTEFSELSDDINRTVDVLKKHIAAEAARIDDELEFARSIQLSALPSVFPAFPGRKEFDLFASMNAAKEVGGDFYDFYFIGRNKIAFVVSDVSGKGIPAAMFMMQAKTMLKGYAEARLPLDEIFSRTNEKLCESNEAGMFVTSWMGELNLVNGLVRFANAGHNPPLLYRKGEGFSYYRVRAGFVLAGMEGMKFRDNEMSLNPGDAIFLYTDGVTEAMDADERLYGEERLLNLLNSLDMDAIDVHDVCAIVKRDLDAFVGEAPQFDDITMLCLRYNGAKEKEKELPMDNELTVEATVENISAVTDFVNEKLEAAGASMKAVMQVDIAVDELFGNIAHYAYGGKTGPATVRVDIVREPEPTAIIAFKDQGKPYNPLAKEDPDTTLSADEREIGGLGIFIVKQSMDGMDYDYVDGSNVLAIKKVLS